MGLEIRQLECFVAVAEERNFGRAALRLHMTQPPLTRRIKQLERDLGAILFVRTPHGVEITPPGEVLLSHARRIVGLTGRAVGATQAAVAGEVGELVVGYFGSVIFEVIPRLLSGLHQEQPDIEIRIDQLPKQGQIEAIRDGWMHIGFARMYAPEEGLCIQHIAEEPWCVALPSSHRLIRRPNLTVQDLDGEELILFPRASRPSFADEVLQASLAAGFSATVRLEAEDAVSALVYVAIGAGIAVVPRSASNVALPGVTFIPLEQAPLERISCIYREADRAPVLRSLLGFIENWSPN